MVDSTEAMVDSTEAMVDSTEAMVDSTEAMEDLTEDMVVGADIMDRKSDIAVYVQILNYLCFKNIIVLWI